MVLSNCWDLRRCEDYRFWFFLRFLFCMTLEMLIVYEYKNWFIYLDFIFKIVKILFFLCFVISVVEYKWGGGIRKDRKIGKEVVIWVKL